MNTTSLSALSSAEKVSTISGKSVHELFEIISDKESHYSYFEKVKPDGSCRVITPPKHELMAIQHYIKTYLSDRIHWSTSVHGGIKGKSIITNAKPHVGKYMVANLDIRNFFPSTKRSRIYEALVRNGCAEEAANLITELTTYKGCLPLGSPTSTLLANLVFQPADKQFQRFCRRRKLRYTRYVDDITISGDYNSKPFKGTFLQFIEQESYEIAEEKVQFCGRNRRQIVTGIIVNDRLRPAPCFIRDLKFMIRECWPEAGGPYLVAVENGWMVAELRQKLWGRINFVRSVDRKLGREIRALMVRIDWRRYAQVNNNKLELVGVES